MKKCSKKSEITILAAGEAPAARGSKKRFNALAGLLTALALCLAAPFVTACDNSSDSATALLLAQMAALQQQQQQQQGQQPAPQPAAPAATNAPAARTITVRGSVAGSYGALPAGAAALVQPQLFDAAAISQSASPDLSAAGYEWFAMAQSGGVTVEGTFVAGSADRAFEIPLEVGKTWNIICGIRVAGGGAHVMADSYPFTATEEDAVLTRAFIPEPVSEGSGSVVLKVALDSSLAGTLAVSKATAFCAADDWPVYDAATGSKEWPLAIEGSTATLTIPEAKRGIYDVAFSFFATGDVFLYATAQTVNVLANAQTDTWALGGGEGKVEGGKLVVDSALVTQTSQTVLYVGTTGAPNAKAPSDANAGGAYAPLAHVAKAVQIIEATATSGSGKAYKIFVCGTVSSASASDNANFSSALDGKAASITISGLNASAAIDAGATGSALTVETKVPVAIKNVKITGGSAEKGGGIFVKGSGVKVTLEGGAKVEGNAATVGGGGAYIEGGAELCVDGGSLLSNTAASGGGVFVAADGSKLLVKGSSSLPYGGQTGDNPPVNDVYLEKSGTGSYSAVEVADGFAPDVSQGKIAISAQGWNRKQVIVKAAAGSGVTDISNCENYFESTAGEVNFSFGGSDKSVAKLTAPYYVSASNGHDTGDTPGTESSPYKTLAFACEQMSGGDKETIYVKNSIGKDSIPASFYGGEKFDLTKCAGLTIQGAGLKNAGDSDQDKIDAGGSGTALTVYADPVKPVPVTIKNLKITGGNNTHGGGLVVSSGATVTLGEEACVAGNKATYGGGVYVEGDLLIDGGVVGDKNATDHAKDEVGFYSNKASEKGGGVAFASTGKVTFKKGVVAYNYSKRGGGIATSFDASSENSQLDLKDGEVCYNCAEADDDFVVGGGLFLKGCKFYFTDGKVHHNYAVAGGGGICLQKTVGAAIMSGGSVYDNEYRNTTPGTKVDHKWGSDLLLFDEATLDMSGGKIDSPSHSQKDYGVMIRTSSCALNISGNAEISKETPLLPGDIIYNEGLDTYTYNDNPITIAGALTPPNPADLSKKNVYIVPAHWQRGLQVLNAPASIPAAEQAALVAANIGRFATTNEEFDVKAKGAAGFISAPLCVAASDSTRKSPVNEGALGQKDWGAPSEADTALGTRSQPFAKMSQAVAQMTDNTAPYEILINGTIKGSAYACAEFDGAKVGDVTIRGVNGDNSIDVLDADKLDATSDRKYPVLAFRGTTGAKISATIQDLKITGGNYLDSTSGSPSGGGISASYTDISLAKGALIAGNQARQGGGLYIKQGKLFVYADARVGEDGDETAGWNMAAGQCSNSANDCGGGIYCDTGGVYLGYKDLLTVATGADKWTGGVYRNHASCDGGGIYVVDGECRLAEGNVSRNSCSGDTGGGGGIFASGVLSVTGGKICGNKTTTKNGGGVCIGFCEFSMSGGEICDNEACLLGGGVCIGVTNPDTSKFTMSGGEICGNKAADGGGIYGKDNVEVSLSGGKIANNDCGAAHILSEKFTMGGSVWIPYGVTDGDTTVTGVGKNDVILDENRYITIESALSLPTGASGANATITPSSWKRGTVIAKGKNSGVIPSGSGDRLGLAGVDGDGWSVYTSSDNKEAKINAPIYVSPATLSPPGNDGNIGTKSAPYLTVTHALDDLNDPSQDYTIYIYGTIIDHVTISQTKAANAKSLTLESGNFNLIGPSSTLSGGCDASTPWGSTAIGRTLSISGDVPVTIKGLKITGGKTSENGGGIYIENGAQLTLDEYCLVTGNYAKEFGAGIFVNDGGMLNIKGCIRVKDNKTVDNSGNVIGDSNVYLPNGNVINVMGSLTQRIPGASSDPGNSEIHVSTGIVPSIGYPVTITYNYSYANSDHPSKFFTSDQNYGFASWNGDDEAELGVHGGSIVIEPTYKDLALSIDKTWAQKGGDDKITAGGTVGGQPMDFDDDTSENYTTLAFDVKTHGESAAGYYSKVGKNAVKFSGSKGKLPAGDYVLLVTGVHGGKTYSASFDIRIIETTVPAGYVIAGGETVTGAVGTKSSSNVFIAGRSVKIPVIIACDHEVTQGEYEKYCCYDGTSRPTEAGGKGPNYPTYWVSWCDAIVYCNLKSLADGLTPVYSLDGVTDPLMWKTSGNVTEGTGDYAGKYHVPVIMSTDIQNNWKNIVFDQNADGWRLPTEVEWEYLARAANKEDYIYSGSDTVSDVAWWSENSAVDGVKKAHEVKTDKTGVDSFNGLGLYDMSGNVFELCWDWKGDISADTKYTGPDSGTQKVYRGGSYSMPNSYSNVSNRVYATPQRNSDDKVGFRVVRTVR